MAEKAVIVNLPTLDAAIRAMGTGVIETGLAGAGTAVAGKIKQSWLKGTGGEGSTLQNPPINKDYQKWKKENAGGRDKIDFMVTSDLSKSFGVKNINDKQAVISFNSDQLPKARGLMGRRPQGMETGPKLTKIAIDEFNKFLRKLCNFQK